MNGVVKESHTHKHITTQQNKRWRKQRTLSVSTGSLLVIGRESSVVGTVNVSSVAVSVLSFVAVSVSSLVAVAVCVSSVAVAVAVAVSVSSVSATVGCGVAVYR